MSDQFLGEIRMFGSNFAPVGWMLCNGQLLPIAENDALYALIGTTFGGDGQTTFGLPDLRGRVPIHQGTPPGGPTYVLGQVAGTETVTLAASQLPAHTHGLQAQAAAATNTNPTNRSLASAALDAYTSSGDALVAMDAQAIAVAGGNQPHENMAPFLAIHFIIAVEGTFPSRN